MFPLVPKPAGCLQRVRLRLRVLGGRGPRAELAVYPSALLSLAKGRRPDPIPWKTLTDNRPRALAEAPLEAPWAEFDVTELYRGDASFPSAIKHIPPGTPLVVSIRPPAWTNESDFVRQFAGAAAGDVVPAPRVGRRQIQGADGATAQLDWDTQARADLDLDGR